MARYTKEWYEKNREKVLAAHKKWRAANAEMVRAQQRRWREANEGHTYETSDGYVRYIGYKHPAATPSGITMYGRIVLWDKLGGRDANCHWCDKPLSWSKKYPEEGALLADHVNNIKNDNRPENLVPSCHQCNVGREGGQARKVSPNKDRPCEAIEGCDRPGKTHAKNKKHLWVCVPHWYHDAQGKEFAPLRTYAPKGQITETHKECSLCREFKPHSDFYIRNGKPKGRCKPCEIKSVKEGKKRREATMGPCTDEEGCDRPAQTKGLCSRHYERQRYREKHGIKNPGQTPKENNREAESE